MTVAERVNEHRQRMRERGFRPIQIWVPDTRHDEFRREAAREAALVAAADRSDDTQDFLDAVAAPWGDE
jgi:hypothetical protein